MAIYMMPTWASAATPTGFEGLSVIPSPPNASVPIELSDVRGTRGAELRTKLEQTTPGWDYVVLDCPPSVGPLTSTTCAPRARAASASA